MIEILQTLFVLFNRKNIKKYLSGELELSEEELNKIQSYIETSKQTHSIEIRIQQLELRKVPVLRDLTLEEADFLLQSDIDFDGILDVVYAKGGIAKGLGSIEWSRENRCYIEKNRYALSMFVSQLLFHVVMLMGLYWLISQLEIKRVLALFLFLIWFLLVTLPMFFLWEHADIKRKLLKEKFPFIFSKRSLHE